MTKYALSLPLVFILCLVVTVSWAQTTLPPGSQDTGIGGVVRITPEGTQQVDRMGQEEPVQEVQPTDEVAPPAPTAPDQVPTLCPPPDFTPTQTVPAVPAEPGRGPGEPGVDEAPLVSPPPPARTEIDITPEPAPAPLAPSPFLEDEFAVLPPAGANYGFWVVVGAGLIGAGRLYRRSR